MSKYICLCLLLFFFERSGFAQDNLAVTNIPKDLKLRANAIVRDQQRTVDMRSPNEVLLHVRQVLTIMNKTALAYSRLALFYDKSTTIKSIHGALYDERGNLMQKISAKDFLDESAVSSFSLFEDSRVKHFLPNILQYPFTVVYDYEIKFKQNLIIPDWTPKPYQDMAIEQSSYNFICGIQDQINIKELNYKGKRGEEKNEKQKSYTWSVNALAAAKTEPLLPPAESYQTSVKIAPQQFFYYRKKGMYRNWEELGRWVYTDLVKEQQVATPAMVAKVNTLVADLTDDRKKLAVLYRYLQERTRYISVQIGIGGFQPMAASEVERLGYGDCKGLVNYMQTLLSIAGIPSYYCVVNAGSMKKNMDTDFASMSQGNHIILAVPMKQDTIWLECTSQKLPFGFLSDFTDDRLVVACTADGGKLLRTPKFSENESAQRRTAQFSLNKDGDIVGAFSTIFSGTQYDNRLGLIDLSSGEQAKALKEIYAVDNVDFIQINYTNDQIDTPSISEKLDISIKRYAPKNGARTYLQPNIFNRKASVPIVQKREMPIYINRGYVDNDDITFTVPENYTVELRPADIKLNTDFGEFVMELKQDHNKLVYHRKLLIKEGTFLPERYADYAKFVNAIYQADLSKVVFLEKD